MKLGWIVAAGFAVIAAACSPGAAKKQAETAESACPDDGPRFPGTGLCIARAVSYIDPAHLAPGAGLPDGCTWEIAETMLPGDQALLYQAMACNGKKTQLEFLGGAHMATLEVQQSGFYAEIPAEYQPVKIVSLFEVPDAKARILAFAREGIENREESAACAVRPRGGDAPDDAFVVDANDAYKQKHRLKEGPGPTDGYVACGPYGYASDGNRFWRVTGGFAFFFDLGQDTPDFNPNSMTVLQKGADGAWSVVK